MLFFITAVASSVIVIYQIRQGDEAQDNAALLEELQASNPELAEQLRNAEQQPNERQGENMLEGTQLANFTPNGDVPELQIIDISEGDGDVVPEGATVVAHYTGAVASTGTIFQSSLDGGQPIPFSLNGVIQGWTQGVPGMKVGGTRRLVIPAELAYGANPPAGSGIPANAPLVFDIEVTELQ